jgi:SLOG cluster2
MSDPTVVGRDALAGARVALSVSVSADLARLGLSEKHCELVVAEVVRSIILAGGTVVYGGRLKPEGYTRILLEEAGRYHDRRVAVELCIAESEYRKLSADELERIDQRLGVAGRLVLVAASGDVVSLMDSLNGDADVDPARGLTSMRTLISQSTDARVVVGGKLVGFAGVEPGLIEEARVSASLGKPVYLAGGYGGAGAALAKVLHADDFVGWAPSDFPVNGDDPTVVEALQKFEAEHRAHQVDLGFDADARRQLASSHRPADIATLVVRGLAVALAGRPASSS